jgi:hypothetical protein
MKKKQHFYYWVSMVQTLMLYITPILSYEIMHWVMPWISEVLNKQGDKCYDKVRHCDADQSTVTTNDIILGTALPIIVVEPTVKVQDPIFIISWVMTARDFIYHIKNNKKFWSCNYSVTWLSLHKFYASSHELN